MPHSTLSKKKKFSSHSRVSVYGTFFEIRSPKKDETTQYFGKRFFINRSQNFIALLNFYARHLGVKNHWSLLFIYLCLCIEPTCSLLELVIDRVKVDPGGVLPVHHLHVGPRQ
jgi:hypothetical protein